MSCPKKGNKAYQYKGDEYSCLTRECPQCHTTVNHINRAALLKALKRNKTCSKCAKFNRRLKGFKVKSPIQNERSRQRTTFYSWLKGKDNGFERYVGKSLIEFKDWISKDFLPNMSWDNWSHSTWHIDHIKPLASFDLMDCAQFEKACHYTKLQPL